MEDSVLITTKKMLGLEDDFKAFDLDIITHINSVFLAVNQLGVGPANGFMIMDNSANWSDFLGEDMTLNAVKSYMYLRVRLLFDPPATSFALNAMKEQLTELEWRINVQREGKEYVNPNLPITSPVFEMPVIDGGIIK